MTKKSITIFLWISLGFSIVLILQSRGTSDVAYFAAWGREVSNGNLFNLYMGGPGGSFSYRLIDTDTYTGTIPYPPVFLYLMGLSSLIAGSIAGEHDHVYRIVANSLGLTGTLMVITNFHAILPRSLWHKYSHLFLISCLVIFSPVLGYQDAIPLAFLLFGLRAVTNARPYMAGFSLAVALLTKQLILIVLPGVLLYLLFSVRRSNFKITLQTIFAFTTSIAVLILPFLSNTSRFKGLFTLIESSKHRVLSANGSNLGWLLTWVSRMRSGVNLETLSMGGSLGSYFNLLIFGNPISIQTILIGIMIISMGTISAICFINRFLKHPLEIYAVCASIYLSYCCFGTGVHENHIYIGLGLVTCADLVRNSMITSLTKTGWLMMILHLYALYGFGRSVSVPRMPAVIIQFTTLTAFIVYLALLVRSVLWIKRLDTRSIHL